MFWKPNKERIENQVLCCAQKMVLGGLGGVEQGRVRGRGGGLGGWAGGQGGVGGGLGRWGGDGGCEHALDPKTVSLSFQVQGCSHTP